jgi:hypothetical protein
LLAAGFVGIAAVVADGLFPLGREVVDDGGEVFGGHAVEAAVMFYKQFCR